MRTTLTIDDDLAALLKRRARELGLPLKDVVNRTLRAGFGEQTKLRHRMAPRTIPHAFGFRPGIDLDKLNQLADELEAETSGQASGPDPGLKRVRGMILPDVNVLVHAHNANSAVHTHARRWWDECLVGPEGVGLA